MSTEKKSLLQTVWERTEAAWDAIKQSRAQANLRAKAEVDLLSLQAEVVEAEAKVDDTIVKSKETHDWVSIRKAALNRDLKRKELEQASILYKEFFLTEPEFLK